MHRSYKYLFIVFLFAFGACSNSIPEDKMNYVGEWRGPGIQLEIEDDGSFYYSKNKGMSHTEIDFSIKEFQGNNFVVGFWFLTTTFVVSKPPYQESGQWKMIVDGVPLTR